MHGTALGVCLLVAVGDVIPLGNLLYQVGRQSTAILLFDCGIKKNKVGVVCDNNACFAKVALFHWLVGQIKIIEVFRNRV